MKNTVAVVVIEAGAEGGPPAQDACANVTHLKGSWPEQPVTHSNGL